MRGLERTTAADASPIITQVDSGPTYATYQGLGRLSVYWRDGAVRLVLSGHGQAGFAPIVERHWEQSLRGSPQIALVADLWDMPTYDSPLRVGLTSWLFHHRPAVSELHVVTRSRIVAMGVGVANLALGGLITHHKTRASLDAVAARIRC